MQQTKAELTAAQIADELCQMTQPHNVEMSAGETGAQYVIQAPVTVCPESEDEVQAILRWANECGLRVAPRAGGTKDAYGSHDGRSDLILSLTKLKGIIEHSAGDLTFTVRPGTTLLEVKQTLQEHGQFLPLDVPWNGRSTVGGLIAAGGSGLKRAMYGSARDYLIASRIVLPDGTLIRTGQKVVKNVAGYDMNKLIIGSMGSLGVITELTFKIRPIPFHAAALVLSFESTKGIQEFQKQLLDLQLEPCAVELIDSVRISQILNREVKGPGLLLLFEDVEASVSYQIKQIKQLCERLHVDVLHQTDGIEASEQLLARMRALPPDANELKDTELVLSLKLISLLTQVPDVYERMAGISKQYGLDFSFTGGCYTGISRAMVTSGWDRKTNVLQWLQQIQSYMSEIKGSVVVETAPRDLRPQIDCWGTPDGAIRLMRGIKDVFDPSRILNNGRCVGGI